MTVCKDIQNILVARGQTLSTAESCTSGRIAAELTKVPGASRYFYGGLVAYQDEVKINLLGVTAKEIAEYDVVSQIVVEQMVRGACKLFGTDYALASTGYADPTTLPNHETRIWIGWGTADDVHSACLVGTMEREASTQNAVNEVLQRFLRTIG